MRLYIIFFSSFFLCQYGFSQERLLDSLKTLVQNHPSKDSIRVKNLIKYTRYTTVHDDSESKIVLDEAIAISKDIDYIKGLGDAYTAYSLYFVRMGDYKSALLYSEKAKDIQKKTNYKKDLLYTNTAIANIYAHLNQPKKAIKIHLENLRLLEKNDPKRASSYFYLAKAYQEIKDYKNAITNYNNAKKIAEKTQFKTGIVIANSSLGTCYVQKGDFLKGIDYLEKSLNFYITNKQKSNMAHTYLELANAYSKLQNQDKAIELNNKAIGIYKKQSVVKSLKKAYFNQSDYYSLKKDYKKANKYLKKYYKIKDSVFSKDNIKVIEDMKAKYETERLTLEKEVVIIKNKQDRNIFIGSLAVLFLVLLTLLFYNNKLKIQKKAELISLELKQTQKRLALEKQYKDSELKALKAQMDPHFIFNALNSIQEYIVLNQKDLASDYLGKFADLIRKYLKHSDLGVINLQEEIDTLKIYLELEKVRFEDTLNYQFIIEKGLNPTEYKIPTMLIQPYIENALKHGLLHRKNGRELIISFSKQTNNIKCIIEDNGVGREKSKEYQAKKSKWHKSFATKATQERLALLNFRKDKKIGVKIIDLYNDKNEAIGTRVILTIPILK